MARLTGAMNRSRKEASVDIGAIDELLKRLEAGSDGNSEEMPADLPQKPDVQKLAERMGISVIRGGRAASENGIAIPDFYSDREARLAIARWLIRRAIERVGSECNIVNDRHDCPSDNLCEFVRVAKENPKTLDIIAASMLMPASDFARWAKILGNEEGALADSYAVPLSLARIRLETLHSEKEQVQH